MSVERRGANGFAALKTWKSQAPQKPDFKHAKFIVVRAAPPSIYFLPILYVFRGEREGCEDHGKRRSPLCAFVVGRVISIAGVGADTTLTPFSPGTR